MKVSIFIVTFHRDFDYLHYCLSSIRKFTSGFSEVVLLIPDYDVELATARFGAGDYGIPLVIKSYAERPGHGMMHHEFQICSADVHCPGADFVTHIDSDCVFMSPVQPEYYFRDGKPILRYEPFTRIGKRWPGVLAWEVATRRNLPYATLYETMRGHPEVYHIGLYARARELIQQTTGKTAEEHILSCREKFPHEFCEFVTLGNVAMNEFPELYFPIEQFSDKPDPHPMVQQFWSHGPIDRPQHIWVNGQHEWVLPLEYCKSLGL